MLDELQEPTFVWWRIDRPALVLSRGSRTQADEDACAAAGVDVVRRGSGGGPVLWTPQLLALDVFVPRTHALWSADVVAAYRWLGRLLAETARALGAVDACAIVPDEARAVNDPDLAAAACYGGVSPWEVMVGARKLVGLSQVRRAKGLLLQVGVLAREEGPIADLLAVDRRDTLRAQLGAGTIGLRELGIDRTVFKDAVDEALHAAAALAAS